MRLSDVARRFDTVPMWDAYNGKKLAHGCQVTAWDSPRRDGLTTVRRTLSTRYGVTLPKRSALIIGAEAWIIARDPSNDSFGKHVSRVGYIAQQAREGKVANATMFANGSGTPTYLSRVWVKDTKDLESSSEVQSQYLIYYAHGENVKQGDFLYADDTWHVCRNTYFSTAGFMVAECNELEGSGVIEVELITQGKWNYVTETHEDEIRETINAVQLSWKDDYITEMPSAEKEMVGDLRLRFGEDEAERIFMDTRIQYNGDTWQAVRMEKRPDGSLSVVFRTIHYGEETT